MSNILTTNSDNILEILKHFDGKKLISAQKYYFCEEPVYVIYNRNGNNSWCYTTEAGKASSFTAEQIQEFKENYQGVKVKTLVRETILREE